MADYIKKANFGTKITFQELYYYPAGSGSGSWKMYMLSPCWHVHVHFNKNWGSWGRDTTVTVWKFNGTDFVQVFTQTLDLSMTDSGTKHIHYYHNWVGQSSEGDDPNYHLWKVEVYYEERYAKYIDIEYGGYGASNQDWQNKKIYSAYPVGYEYLWLQNGAWQDDMAKEAGRTSRRRFTHITHNNEDSCCYTEDHNR